MSVGLSMERVGARQRTRGEVRFGADMGEPGDLFLACVRAEQAPAKIIAIDSAPAMAVPGVVRVFTAKDVPGEHQLGIIPVTKDQEFLAVDTVRHTGQTVAFVAAETPEAALAGARAVKLNLENLPGVFDAAEALQDGAPLIFPGREGGNLLAGKKIIKGDADKALADSAVVVKGTYSTNRLEHSALETEGGRAEYQDGRVIVWACTQNPHYDQADLVRFLGVPEEKVRVIQAETGGGFGGKLDLSVQPYLALAALLLKRPVRMTFTREETFLASGKRHAFEMRYTSGADEKGRITGMKIDLLSGTGAFASYGLAVTMRAIVHATGPYLVPNLIADCRMAYTNETWNGAMRGFGVPQVAVGHEGQMDALAHALNMDPLEFRLINALRPGQKTATGQLLEKGVGIAECLEKIKPIYQEWNKRKHSDERTLEGVGLGAMFYGIGNTGVSNPSSAQIEWTQDGRVILYTGAAEIGQGSDTVLTQLAAARLGLDAGKIELCRGDTDRTTNAGATSASRQTYISGNAVVAAAENLEMTLLNGARQLLGELHLDVSLDGEAVKAGDGSGREVAVTEVVKHLAAKGQSVKADGKFDPNFSSLDPETGQGRPYATYAYAAQCAWVDVDTASGMTRVKEVAAAHDVGRAVNRRAVKGQICGGVMMGVGMALMEEYETQSCDNFQNYHIPTTADAPAITPIIVEDPEPTGPYGAKGVGEPALIPTAPAVASAMGDALGKPMRHLPISLERIMAALSDESGKDHGDED